MYHQYIDHTLLKAEATKSDIKKLCQEAIEHGLYAVCISPNWIPFASKLLKDSDTKLATVAAFPSGALSPEQKEAEVLQSIKMGAQEIDMVLNLGAVKSEDWSTVTLELKKSASLCKKHKVLLKLIFETAALSTAEILKVKEIAIAQGVDFLKTSTGMHPMGGATIEAVSLLAKDLPSHIKVKASGGIRTSEEAKQMISAGASRIGASRSLDICSG